MRPSIESRGPRRSAEVAPSRSAGSPRSSLWNVGAVRLPQKFRGNPGRRAGRFGWLFGDLLVLSAAGLSGFCLSDVSGGGGASFGRARRPAADSCRSGRAVGRRRIAPTGRRSPRFATEPDVYASGDSSVSTGGLPMTGLSARYQPAQEWVASGTGAPSKYIAASARTLPGRGQNRQVALFPELTRLPAFSSIGKNGSRAGPEQPIRTTAVNLPGFAIVVCRL